ncbi:hypothetical protein EDC96DRAFT_513815, partial [Choanephora cucurbitarum]
MLKVVGLPLCLSVSAASARVRRFGKRLLATLGHEGSSRLCSVLYSALLSLSQSKNSRKANKEIVNVYLLFCLYITYCFKQLSS